MYDQISLTFLLDHKSNWEMELLRAGRATRRRVLNDIQEYVHAIVVTCVIYH